MTNSNINGIISIAFVIPINTLKKYNVNVNNIATTYIISRVKNLAFANSALVIGKLKRVPYFSLSISYIVSTDIITTVGITVINKPVPAFIYVPIRIIIKNIKTGLTLFNNSKLCFIAAFIYYHLP